MAAVIAHYKMVRNFGIFEKRDKPLVVEKKGIKLDLLTQSQFDESIVFGEDHKSKYFLTNK